MGSTKAHKAQKERLKRVRVTTNIPLLLPNGTNNFKIKHKENPNMTFSNDLGYGTCHEGDQIHITKQERHATLNSSN